MPLVKSGSNAAFKKNVSTLMRDVGKSPHVKSPAQALAIAYDTKRRNRADGGPVMDPLRMMMGGGAPQTPSIGTNPAISSMGVAPPPMQMPNAGAMPPSSMLPGVAGMPNQQFNRGGTPNLAVGGLGIVKPPKMTPTWQERQQARSMTHGPILSAVPGRTDAHQTHVPSGSYVIPADIVSGRGQGNTIAGASALSKLFKLGPYGSGSPAIHAGSPHPARAAALRAAGGRDGHHVGKPVRVNLAGGEIVVSPEHLLETFRRLYPKNQYSLKQIHSIMDAWVLHERKKLRQELAKLPGPVRE